MALCRFSSIARQGSIVAQHWLWPFGVSGSSDHCFRCWAKGGLVAGYLPHGNSPRPMIKHSQNRGLLGDLHIFWDHGMKLFDHGLGVFHTLGDEIIHISENPNIELVVMAMVPETQRLRMSRPYKSTGESSYFPFLLSNCGEILNCQLRNSWRLQKRPGLLQNRSFQRQLIQCVHREGWGV